VFAVGKQISEISIRFFMKIESQFLNRAYFGLFMIWMFFKICRRKISKDLQEFNQQIKKMASDKNHRPCLPLKPQEKV